MKSKPLKIDWDGLEDAFNEQRTGLVSYLDLVTGQVVLEGEGETEDLDAGDYDDDLAGEIVSGPAQDATRLYISPPATEHKIEWLREFLRQDPVEPATLAEFELAIAEPDPAAALRDALNRHPPVRDAWYRYRSERIQSLIDDWLASNGVHFVDPPPWS
jgi:hypothetical protein